MEEVESFKIILVGESGVGKTSIITQFVDETFQQDQQSTIGGTFSNKTLKCDNKILKLEIWDTAGQERYRSVTTMFYKDSNAAILVYDITSKYSFEELRDYWIQQIIETAPKNLILVIAANKSDLIENQIVDEEEAREVAKKYNALFFETSAKNQSGINDLFIQIAKKYTNAKKVEIIIDKDEEYSQTICNRKDVSQLTASNKGSKEKKRGCC